MLGGGPAVIVGLVVIIGRLVVALGIVVEAFGSGVQSTDSRISVPENMYETYSCPWAVYVPIFVADSESHGQ